MAKVRPDKKKLLKTNLGICDIIQADWLVFEDGLVFWMIKCENKCQGVGEGFKELSMNWKFNKKMFFCGVLVFPVIFVFKVVVNSLHPASTASVHFDYGFPGS